MENKKIKFYSLNKILKTQSTYNVIFGERSNGKTYSVLLHGISEYFKTGGQIAIVRRWKEDITGRRASDIFSALNANDEIKKISKGKYSAITYYAGKFYRCNYDENGKSVYNIDSDCLGYVFALSDMEHNKSVSYPLITTILFDEFITKFTYLKDEFVLFMNTVSTIVRQRTNVTIFMLGNTVNKFCPYFDEMGLTNILEMKQGSIDIYKYGDSGLKVAVEYCSNLSSNKKNNFYFAFNNPKLEMITGGAWELDIYPHLPVKYTPKNVLFKYYIEFNDFIYQANIICVDGEYFTYIHEKTTEIREKNPLIYSLAYSHKSNYNRSIYRVHNDITKKISYFFKMDRVFYQNNSVGDSIANYLKYSRRL